MKSKTNSKHFFLKMLAIGALLFLTEEIKLYGQGQIANPITFTTWAATSLGNQYATDVTVDGNGDSYTVGFFKSPDIVFGATNIWGPINNTDPTGNTEDGYLVKWDKGDVNGNSTPSDWPLWAVKVGGTGNDRCASVTTLGDGTGGFYIYVVGWYTTTATFESVNPNQNITLSAMGGIQNAYIARYDQNGNLHYVYNIGAGGCSGADFAYHVAAAYDNITGDRAIYIAGRNGCQTSFICNGANTSVAATASAGGDDGFLVRYTDFSTYADPDWIRVMSSNASDAYYSIAANGSGVSVGGQFKGNMGLQLTANTFTPPIIISGSSDIIVANYDRYGTNVWYKRLGGNGTGLTGENATCVTIDIDGNTYAGGMYYGSGSTFSCPNGGQECFVTKINSAGTTIWNQCGGTTGNGAGDDYVAGIAIDRCQKHLYIGGVSHGATLHFGLASLPAYSNGSNNDNFFLELDPLTGSYIPTSGNVFGSGGNDVTYGLCIDRLDYVYMVGISNAATWNLQSLPALNNAASGTYDGFLWRFNECHWPAVSPVMSSYPIEHRGINVFRCNIYCFGDMQETHTYGSQTHSSTFDGHMETFDSYLTTLDKFGNYTGFSMIAHGTSEEFISDQDMDAPHSSLYAVGHAVGPNTADFFGNPYTTVVGNTTTYLLAGPQYASIVKTDLNGTPLWSRLGIANNIYSSSIATGVAVDKVHGYVYMYGTFQGSVTFGTITINSVFTNVPDLFLVKYDLTGGVMWAMNIGHGTGSQGANSSDISVNETTGDCYTTGTFSGQYTWNATTLTSTGVNNLFIARVNSSGVVLQVGYYPFAGSYGFGIVAANSQANQPGEVYVAGYSGTGAHVSRWNFPVSGTPFFMWTQSGNNNSATAICMDNSKLYITGLSGPTGSSSVGSQSYTSNGLWGVFVASVNRMNNIVNCLGVRNPFTFGSACGIAQDGYTGNVYVAGQCMLNSGFVQEFSPDYCNYSNRLAGGNSDDAANPDVAIAGKPPVANVVNLFPNPSDGSMTLQISGTSDQDIPASLAIIDLSGRAVLRKDNIVSEQTPIEGTELANGVYIYEVVRNNVVIGNGRIVITR